MPTLVLTDPVNDTVTDANVIANNNTAIKNIINGAITNDNLSASANIAVTKIAAGTNGTVLTTTAGVVGWATPSAPSQQVPTGTVVPYAGSAAPTDWLLCDGSAVSQATYAALYSVIGVTFGNPGGGSFNLPDLQGRMPVGKGTHADVDTMGENDGSTLANRRPKHNHTINDPGHFHTYQVSAGTSGGAGSPNTNFETTANTDTKTTGVTVGPQTAGTPTDGPAYIVLNYIIRT